MVRSRLAWLVCSALVLASASRVDAQDASATDPAATDPSATDPSAPGPSATGSDQTAPSGTSDEAVGLRVTGAHAPEVAAAFTGLAPGARTLAPDAPRPRELELVVSIDTDEGAARVWRRADGLRLERRLPPTGGDDDAYSLALVATELLEVVRSGVDPASAGATVLPPEPADGSVDGEPTEAAADGEADPGLAPADGPSEAPAPAATGARLAFTVSAGAEGWAGLEADAPWIVQPTLGVDLAGGPAAEDWVLVLGVQGAALGGFTRDAAGTRTSYQRVDVTAQLGAGGDVGPARTRLLAHLRLGVAAVMGAAEREGNESGRATRAGWALGAAFEVRQPLVLGLELGLAIFFDVVPAPVRLLGDSATLLVEAPARLGARLSLGWRIE